MKKYKVFTNVNFLYEVKAKDEEDAMEKIHNQEIEPKMVEVVTDEIQEEKGREKL